MPPEGNGKRSVDSVVAELRAKVEARRQAGEYPAELVGDLAERFRRLLRRPGAHSVELRAPIERARGTLPLRQDRIQLESRLPAGPAVHRAVSKLVGRQTQGVLDQVEAFAEPVIETLDVLATAVEELAREVRDSGLSHFHQGPAMPGPTGDVFRPWYSSVRFEDEFRGSREVLLDRYRDVAARLSGCGPVFDMGCGRGEFLELLAGMGVEAWGVDLDEELVRAAIERGLAAVYGDGLRLLRRLEDGALGGLVLIQVVEHLTPQQVVDLVGLATAKVRPGGQVLVETVNPQSLYVLAHSFYLDPTHLRPVHPAYLVFLFKEAGFASVDIEWRSPTPAGDRMEETGDGTEGMAVLNANARRLNELLFAPQDYLLAAVR